jgi:transcriptional regulator with XRE-family HTH domain
MSRVRTKLQQDVDRHVATKIRERRIQLGLSRQTLAGAIGLTYQQLHKYETGENRVTIGRLAEIARALDVPLAFFLDAAVEASQPTRRRDRRLLELARLASGLDDRRLKALNEVARVLSRDEQPGERPEPRAA